MLNIIQKFKNKTNNAFQCGCYISIFLNHYWKIEAKCANQIIIQIRFNLEYVLKSYLIAWIIIVLIYWDENVHQLLHVEWNLWILYENPFIFVKLSTWSSVNIIKSTINRRSIQKDRENNFLFLWPDEYTLKLFQMINNGKKE